MKTSFFKYPILVFTLFASPPLSSQDHISLESINYISGLFHSATLSEYTWEENDTTTLRYYKYDQSENYVLVDKIRVRTGDYGYL